MSGVTILHVPDVALEKILSFLSYDEIATNRLVCQRFNAVCGGLLTKGFIQFEKKHTHIYKLVRALLPRRPSERRSNMVVSRYCEILHAMESRIRMLDMTYMRYIERHLICFLPGKVLDEIGRLLSLIESRFDPPQNINQLMEELRDLSSMAMEHFDEHILPHLEKRDEVVQYKHVIPIVLKPPEDDRIFKELRKIHKRNRVFKSQLTYLAAKTRRMCEKFNRQNLRVKAQSTIIKEQKAKLQFQATRIENHEMAISELKKKFEEMQTSFIESKRENEANQICAHAPVIAPPQPIKDPEPESLTRNLRRMIQFETMRQRSSIKKKISESNRPVSNKPRTPKLKTDDTKRRRFRSMVDVDIWRHRCPTSRLTYSLWQKNYLRSVPNEKIEVKPDQPGTSEDKPTKSADFMYKTIIKQRSSRVFPLTRLDLERKRKSYMCPDIPSKLSKNETSNTLKALGLIDKYLTERSNSDGAGTSNMVSRKRKREIDEDI